MLRKSMGSHGPILVDDREEQCDVIAYLERKRKRILLPLEIMPERPLRPADAAELAAVERKLVRARRVLARMA